MTGETSVDEGHRGGAEVEMGKGGQVGESCHISPLSLDKEMLSSQRGQAWGCQTVGVCVCMCVRDGGGFTRCTLSLWGLGPRLSACEMERGTFTAVKEEEVEEKRRKLITALQVLATGST